MHLKNIFKLNVKIFSFNFTNKTQIKFPLFRKMCQKYKTTFYRFPTHVEKKIAMSEHSHTVCSQLYPICIKFLILT